MTHEIRSNAGAERTRSARGLGWLAGVVLLVSSLGAYGQAPAASGDAAAPLSAEELTKLVGPIALYPDDLVAIVLPAATNPLQLVQADRYLDKRKADPKLPVDPKWDDPVKSLLNYPDVVKKMSADLDWTSALGEAVVADQGAVIEAVQTFRRQANAAGHLKSDDKQVVKVEQEIVIIQPADPQVVYVPQYNPATVVVYGAAPAYAYYPTPYPSYYYPYAPGAAMAAGVIWGAAIGAAWSGNHYGCCGDANINVNRNTNINTGNINTGNINRGSGAAQRPAATNTAWKSNKQPGQVSGSVGTTASNRAGAAGSTARAGAGASATATGGAGRAQSAGSVSAGGAAARTGGSASGATRTGGGGGGGDAFGSYGSGRQTQMDSSRGASSRASGSGASARPTSGGSASRSAPSGGGARGGGGGGRGGGGGGRGGGGRR